MSLLEVADLDAGYGPVQVLHNVSLKVDDGQAVAVLGANGAGKTTLLRAICGMLGKPKGTITFDGQRLIGKKPEAVARLRVLHVPEGRGTFVDLTVEQNLLVGAYRRKDRAGVREDIDQMCQLFPVLGQRRSQTAGELSGGEQQMLALARALVGRPRLLLLDEPSLGLAPLVTRQIFDAVADVLKGGDLSVIVVEQNAQLALQLANYAYVLEVGSVSLSGPADQIMSDPTVRRSYLGY
jgi:branched-chain amino acid transport system ATP-binding protein